MQCNIWMISGLAMSSLLKIIVFHDVAQLANIGKAIEIKTVQLIF